MSRADTPPSIPLRRRLRRRLHRHKRLLACLLLSCAAGVAVEALVGDEAATTPVLATTRDLPVGTVLTDANLTVIGIPEQMIGPGILRSSAEVVGEQLASPLAGGSPIAATALVGDALLTGMPPGTVAVPLRPEDPSTVQLLAPGQFVDVILSTGNGYDVATDTRVLARSVPVLWTAPDGSGNSWAGADTGLVVVAAGPGDAADLAGASSSGEVHLVLTSGQ